MNGLQVIQHSDGAFLSIQAQDFIEELMTRRWMMRRNLRFLSIQAQDFIEENTRNFVITYI